MVDYIFSKNPFISNETSFTYASSVKTQWKEDEKIFVYLPVFKLRSNQYYQNGLNKVSKTLPKISRFSEFFSALAKHQFLIETVTLLNTF